MNRLKLLIFSTSIPVVTKDEGCHQVIVIEYTANVVSDKINAIALRKSTISVLCLDTYLAPSPND
ncbi:hypothetical protein OGM63_25635 [Plectonema radiosum NIES-515]|uniref:Uncharacterized protein n=1 Tax=Plectonema radiosum NIES-515 TaxID=2986073 RepID=A0ABT3B633_9CYAN|nr:hypothetical protein [Plectonema radiosum]MCV3216848.1 hypothetical protein [Plectonema radiosum NIES-515]